MLVIAGDDVSFDGHAANELGGGHGGAQLLQPGRRVHAVHRLVLLLLLAGTAAASHADRPSGRTPLYGGT